MKKYIPLLILFYCSTSFAQTAWTNYSTANSPLPENSIRCISIDAQGRKWIGTDYGLSVYDDINWTNYFTSNSGLPDNAVRSVVFDTLQNAWIGTFNGGLAKFDGATWTVYDISNSGMPDNSVKSLAFDSTGVLWIGTLGGLAKFDGTNWLLFNQGNSLLMSDNIAAIHPSANSRIFIGTVNGGLAIVDNDTIKDVYTIANGSGIPDNTQVGFTEDSTGNVWIATPANGIVVYRIVGGWFWYYMGNSLIPTNALSAIKFNNVESALWLSTLDSGLVKKTGVSYQSFTMANSLMPDNTVQCFTLDFNDVIWIGTASQGVVRFEESLTGILSIVEQASKVSLYPNPAQKNLHLKSNTTIIHFELCDLRGKVLSSMAVNAEKITLDISRFSNGFYLARLFLGDGNVETRKFIKQ